MKQMPILYIFAGPNGSGKSTVTQEFRPILPDIYINADDIKRNERLTDMEAFNKANLLRENCLKNKISFATETVLSHPSKIEMMRVAKKKGFEIVLVFVTTFNPKVNVLRVEDRVQKGGHDVPTDKIIDRYRRSMALLPAAIAVADFARVYNNTLDSPVLILSKQNNEIELYPQPQPSYWNIQQLEKLKASIHVFTSEYNTRELTSVKKPGF